MKFVLAAALAAFSVYAQDVKTGSEQAVAPAPDKPVPSERQLTEAEVLRLQLDSAKAQLLQDKYKLAEYQQELAPIMNDQEQLAIAACKSIGIPDALIRTQCQI